MVHRLADVMEGPRLARGGLGQAQLGSQDAAEVAGLLAVQQRVLTVGEAVVEDPEQLGELRAPLHRHLPEGALPELGDGGGEPATGAQDEGRDVRRLEAAVEHLERGLPGDLPPHRVEAAQGRLPPLVVDPEVGPGGLRDHLEGGEDPLPARLVEPVQIDGGEPRCGVDVALGLPLDGFHQQHPGGRPPARPVRSATSWATRSDRSASSSPSRFSSTMPPSGLQVGGGALGDGAAHLGPGDLDLGGPRVDLLPPLAVGEAALVEDRPPVPPGPLALCQRRLARLQGRPADPHLLGDGLADGERLGPGRSDDGGRLGAHLGQAGRWRRRRGRHGPGAGREHQGDGAHGQEGGDGEEDCGHGWWLSLRWRHVPGLTPRPSSASWAASTGAGAPVDQLLRLLVLGEGDDHRGMLSSPSPSITEAVDARRDAAVGRRPVLGRLQQEAELSAGLVGVDAEGREDPPPEDGIGDADGAAGHRAAVEHAGRTRGHAPRQRSLSRMSTSIGVDLGERTVGRADLPRPRRPSRTSGNR